MRLFGKAPEEPGPVPADFDPAVCFCGCGAAVPQELEPTNRLGSELLAELMAWQDIERDYSGREIDISPMPPKSASVDYRLGPAEITIQNLRARLGWYQDAMHGPYELAEPSDRREIRKSTKLRRKYSSEKGVNPAVGGGQGLVPQAQVQELARQFLIELSDVFDDMQEGRLKISDAVVDVLRAAHVFFIEEDQLDAFPEEAKLFLNTLSRMGYLARLHETEITHAPPAEQLESLAAKIAEVAEDAESVGMGVANLAYSLTVSEEGEDQEETAANSLDTLGSGWLDEIATTSIRSLMKVSPEAAQLPDAVNVQLLKNFWKFGYFIRLCGEAVPDLWS